MDLARLYTGLIGGEERRTKAEIYNKRFYAYLEEALQEDDIPLPYTFEQVSQNATIRHNNEFSCKRPITAFSLFVR